MLKENTMKYLFLDTESGGPSGEYSLLTAAFIVMDDGYYVVDSLNLALKHEIYKIQPGGMAVNKIDLIEHDKTAITPSAAGQQLREFLKKHYVKDGGYLIPVGHGLEGDQQLIWDQLLGKKTWSQYVSFCGLDTGVITKWLAINGKIKGESLNLFNLCKELQVDVSDLVEHTADGDAVATARLLHKTNSYLR